MAILHGSWLLQPQTSSLAQPSGVQASCFLIWGEAWRRVEPQAEDTQRDTMLPHPFVITAAELIEGLRSLHHSRQINWAVSDVPLEARHTTATKTKSARSKAQSATQTLEAATLSQAANARWQSVALALPTYPVEAGETEEAMQTSPSRAIAIPQHSAAPSHSPDENAAPTLQVWQIQGVCLKPLEAIQFLQSLPLSSVSEESWLSGDLRFWSHVARWHLDLLARSKFLPILERSDEVAIARWQTLLDSAADQARLEHFSRQMPAVCRAYQPSSTEPIEAAL
ncbi:MAG: hypothetical protein HC879_18800, partial [Leptolyngbyaceae cyanobacterium SL_5_9]|nr:hypothetical protein [Leptolyngbyaceae cyanobacterium SL_5_9]